MFLLCLLCLLSKTILSTCLLPLVLYSGEENKSLTEFVTVYSYDEWLQFNELSIIAHTIIFIWKSLSLFHCMYYICIWNSEQCSHTTDFLLFLPQIIQDIQQNWNLLAYSVIVSLWTLETWMSMYGMLMEKTVAHSAAHTVTSCRRIEAACVSICQIFTMSEARKL